MKTLLLCGYRSSENLEDPLGLARDADGVTTIDRRIQQLTAMGLEVLCVVSGSTADEQLRHCTRIANVELIYDDEREFCLATNVRASLSALDDEGCFILPVEVPCPPADYWQFMKEEWRRVRFNTPHGMLQGVDAQGAPLHFGFPLVLTRQGNKTLQEHPTIRSLVDARLNYLHLVYQAHASLAPWENPA